MTTTQPSHGGILFQLEMFRPTMMAAVIAQGLASKARNMLDATLELTRHPTAPIVIAQIKGSVVGDDAAEFWRENAELAVYASQELPRQCFIYYVRSGEDRREGFIVAQQGQVLVAHDATAETIPENTPDDQWPVGRLCEQMRLSVDELAEGFADGPRISIPLADPVGDDQKLLMILAGQGGEPEDEDPGSPSQSPSQSAAAPGPKSAAGAARGPNGAQGGPKRLTVDDDVKRRAAARAAETAALAARSAELCNDLPYTVDERGLLVAPNAELEETALLAQYAVKEIAGGLPDSLPDSLRVELQGRALDFAVKVDFLSEVFLKNRPLTRPDFEANATDYQLAGETVKILEVFAPRLGAGSLLRRGKSNVFVSRRPDAPLPAEFLSKLLG